MNWGGEGRTEEQPGALGAQAAGPTSSTNTSPFTQDMCPPLTLVRSFLAFSSLSISTFWALAAKTRAAVTEAPTLWAGDLSQRPLRALRSV